MYSVIFKGKPIPKNPKMVKIEMVFFKTGYTRVPQILDITGHTKDWDSSSGSFSGKSIDCLNISKPFDMELLKHEFGYILQVQKVGLKKFYSVIAKENLESAMKHGATYLFIDRDLKEPASEKKNHASCHSLHGSKQKITHFNTNYTNSN